MKLTTVRFSLLPVFVSLVLQGAITAWAEDATQNRAKDYSPSAVASFFSGQQNDLHPELRLYARRPEETRPLNNLEYPSLARDFFEWAQEIFKSEYVPDPQFVAEHMELFPAPEKDKADSVFLQYRIGAIDYMMVQTAGQYGRIFLYVKYPQKKTLQTNDDARVAILNEVQKYLKRPLPNVLPDFVITENNGIRNITAKHSEEVSHVIRWAICAISGNEVVISFYKEKYGENPPPGVMRGNEWFETIKKGQDYQKRRQLLKESKQR